MRVRPWFLCLAVVLSATAASAAEINWQEAVARLARERTLAESCVKLLKKYGDTAAVDRGSLAYADAKAEYDYLIAGQRLAAPGHGSAVRHHSVRGQSISVFIPDGRCPS